MSIAGQPLSGLAQLARADAVAIMQAVGCDATYIQATASSGVTVRVRVSPTEAERRDAPPQARGVSAGGSPVSKGTVEVLAAGYGETGTSGVTSTGRVLALVRGDRFVVPGWAWRDPTAATVTLRVIDHPRLIEGVKWVCEVTA
jgi:hypothetical protein